MFNKKQPEQKQTNDANVNVSTTVVTKSKEEQGKEEFISKEVEAEAKVAILKEDVKLDDPIPTSKYANTKEHPCSFTPHISPLNLLHPDKLANTPRDCNHIIEAFHAKTPMDDLMLPIHKNVVTGVTKNGLSYAILPAKAPAERFEAHLQICAGSADELEPQQGIAHLTEHVAYMGSRKRERLFGTGSQTNAYTDFHQTVFYACCPCISPGTKDVKMLPYALDALSDVMEAESTKVRLEKERSAVLSEMTMVNTIEYRVECQILGTLHAENRLASRFPIGKEYLIKSWKREDVLRWHRTHFRPDNAILYIVGDVDPNETISVIEQKFGHITAAKQASILKDEYKVAAGDLMERIVGENTVSRIKMI